MKPDTLRSVWMVCCSYPVPVLHLFLCRPVHHHLSRSAYSARTLRLMIPISACFRVCPLSCSMPYWASLWVDWQTQNRGRNLLLAGVTLWSTMTVLCGNASTFWELFFARMGVGVVKHALCLRLLSYCWLFSTWKTQASRSWSFQRHHAGGRVAQLCGGMVADYVQNGGPREIFLFGLVQPWQLDLSCGLPEYSL